MYKAYVVIDLHENSDVQKVINTIKQTPGLASVVRSVEELSDLWHREHKAILITAQLPDTQNTSIFMGEVTYEIADHIKGYRMMDVKDNRKKNQFKNV